MQKLSVSALICTKDRPGETLTCIKSITGQDYPVKEIVIIDSSSRETLETEIGILKNKALHIDFKYIHTTPGLTHQRNVGIKNSSGSIVLFLDDDLVLEPTFLRKIIEIFNKYSCCRIGGVMGNIVNAKNTKVPFLMRFKRKIFFLPEYGNGRFKLSGANTNPIGGQRISATEYLAGGLTAYRKEVFDDFMFDEDFFTGSAYLEDDDFSYRVSRKFMNIYTPYAECFHFDSLSNKLSGQKLLDMHITNFKYFFNKNMPKSLFHKAAFNIALFGITHRVDKLPFSQITALIVERLIGPKFSDASRTIYRKITTRN